MKAKIRRINAVKKEKKSRGITYGNSYCCLSDDFPHFKTEVESIIAIMTEELREVKEAVYLRK